MVRKSSSSGIDNTRLFVILGILAFAIIIGTIVGSSYREKFSNEKTLVYIYMDECQHCKNFEPIWDKIVKKVKVEWSQINKWWEKEEDENEAEEDQNEEDDEEDYSLYKPRELCYVIEDLKSKLIESKEISKEKDIQMEILREKIKLLEEQNTLLKEQLNKKLK